MDDIVERLLAPSYWLWGSSEGYEEETDVPFEAADEIERLRLKYVSDLSRAVGLLEGMDHPDAFLQKQLDAALKGDE